MKIKAEKHDTAVRGPFVGMPRDKTVEGRRVILQQSNILVRCSNDDVEISEGETIPLAPFVPAIPSAIAAHMMMAPPTPKGSTPGFAISLPTPPPPLAIGVAGTRVRQVAV